MISPLTLRGEMSQTHPKSPTTHVRSEFPYRVLEREDVPIVLSDGTRLSARLFLPEHAGAVPAILEYMPYRKRDHNRNRDQMMHRYFAGFGYACLRVDTRGSGDSEGVLEDEFTRQQTDDGVEIVNWIAAQPWCSGSVGMVGRSWSGFSALQVASRAPTPLKAIIPVCAGIDRYRQGLHFSGGCFLTDNLHWATTMLMLNLRPPARDSTGDRYDNVMRQRLEGNTPWIYNWLEHQFDDEYYLQGSALPLASSFRAAIYFAGGWFDHFASAVPEAIERFRVPVRGLNGPWAHHFGHDGNPGPRMGWLQECLRWWDRWLKGVENGIEREPKYTAWLFDPPIHPPYGAECAGRWVSEPTWPSPNINSTRFFLGAGTLSTQEVARDHYLRHRSPLSLGMASGGDYCRLGAGPGEAPLDQTEDDALSLTFETDVLTHRIEMLGAPVLHLRVSADAPVAMVAVRLNDVAPDGSSARVSYGFLNLTHRDSHTHPEALEPGRFYDVSVTLNHIGYAFLPEHRIRIAVSSSYWPFVWPSPTPVTLTIRTAASALELPVRPPRHGDPIVRFHPPEAAEPVQITVLEPARIRREYRHDLLSSLKTLTIHYSGGYLGPGRMYRIDPPGTVLGHEKTHEIAVSDNDPLSARYSVSQQYDMAIDGKEYQLTSRIRMWASADRFFTEISACAFENSREIWRREWHKDFPRRLV